MPITSSAKKALRVSKRKRVYNVRTRDAIVDITKKIKKLVADKNQKEAMKLLPTAYAIFDKAAKTDFIKTNTADRKKSRLSAMIKKVA
ncbi:MAG TPA: 30S ribosomal protein S20 [Candidatus Paceibacterota bacterium]|jgi:ribosomal protein S20|nr:30S ribosomal protein S20 [Candidatus Paceibacterota bacterium]